MNKLAIKHLGKQGRLINSSKGQYLYDNPKNLVVFNANVFVEDQKIWYGDLDLTRDLPKLFELARELDLRNTSLSVYTEMGGRFDNETLPNKEELVLDIIQLAVFLSTNFQEYYEYKNESFQKRPQKPTKKTKSEVIKHNKSDFTPILEFSDLEKYRATGKESTECPYYKFYAPIAEKLGISTNKLQCASVYVHPKVEKKLKVLTRTWLKKFHKLEGYKLQKELGWLWLDISPGTFDTTTTWTKQNIAYIKKIES